MTSIPKVERAVILQGGGSLGAYEAGAYKAGYSFLKHRDKEKGTILVIFSAKFVARSISYWS